MNNELKNAHAMLDKLGACGNQGSGSVRERLTSLFREFIENNRPLPTIEEVNWAHWEGERRRIKDNRQWIGS